MDDHHIIELYFARDERAITETAMRYGALCHSVADNILHNRSDAEECVSDTYLRAWNAIPPERPAALAAFLCRITRNLALDRYRARHRQRRNDDLTLSFEELSDCIPMRDEDAGELPSLLNGFLGTLEPPERQLFCGRYWHACSVKGLARTHGLTPKAVTMRLSRTRDKLRKYLEERGYSV